MNRISPSGGMPPPSYDFFETPKSKPMPHMGVPPLTNKATLKKKSKKSETAINTCVSLMKQHWKKIVLLE